MKLARHVVEVLNRALKADPSAVNSLFAYRTPCNAELADDPTIQVRTYDGPMTVGLLGLVNGLVGVDSDGWGYIASVEDDETESIIRFEIRKAKHHE